MLVYGNQTGLYSSKHYCQIRDLIYDAKENALTLSYHYEKRRTLQQSNPGAFRKGLSRNEERTCNEAFESLKKKVQDLRNILLGDEMNLEATDELTQYTHQNVQYLAELDFKNIYEMFQNNPESLFSPLWNLQAIFNYDDAFSLPRAAQESFSVFLGDVGAYLEAFEQFLKRVEAGRNFGRTQHVLTSMYQMSQDIMEFTQSMQSSTPSLVDQKITYGFDSIVQKYADEVRSVPDEEFRLVATDFLGKFESLSNKLKSLGNEKKCSLTRDHVVGFSVWKRHFANVWENMRSCVPRVLPRSKALELNEKVVHGDQNLVMMPLYDNSRLKGMVEAEVNFRKPLKKAKDLVEYLKSIRIEYPMKEFKFSIATEALLNEHLKITKGFLTSKEYRKQKSSVFALYEKWLHEAGFSEQCVRDISIDLIRNSIQQDLDITRRIMEYNEVVEELERLHAEKMDEFNEMISQKMLLQMNRKPSKIRVYQ